MNMKLASHRLYGQKLEHSAPRILIAIPTEAHGGCEYNALSFAADLAANYDCNVWISFPYNNTLNYLVDLARLNGVNYIPLDCEFLRTDTPQTVQDQERAIWKVLEKIHPDAAFVPLPWPKRGQGLISGIAATGIPALVKFALVPEDWDKNTFVHAATRRSQAENQIWFSNSHYSSRLLESHFRLPAHSVDAFHVGPIGLNRLREPDQLPDEGSKIEYMSKSERLGFSDLGDEDLVITTVARLSEQKGYFDLLAAAETVIADHPNLRFVWVGDGPLKDQLEAEISAKGLDAHFSLLGFRKDVREILQESDLFVLPTVYEGGCSQALLEAMEENLPVIVSDTSAVTDVIRHGENGLLSRRCDAADLTTQILTALKDASLRQSLAQNASGTVKLFSAEIMFAETRARLEKLLHHPFRKKTANSAQVEPFVPKVALEKTDVNLSVDLRGSEYLAGLQFVEGDNGKSDRVRLNAKGALYIEDAELCNATGVYLAGSVPTRNGDATTLHASLNGEDLHLNVKQCGTSWTAFGKFSPQTRQKAEGGATITLEMSGQHGTTPALAIRKIAFPLGSKTRADTVKS